LVWTVLGWIGLDGLSVNISDAALACTNTASQPTCDVSSLTSGPDQDTLVYFYFEADNTTARALGLNVTVTTQDFLDYVHQAPNMVEGEIEPIKTETRVQAYLATANCQVHLGAHRPKFHR
jgi:hypothetical protein